LSQSPRSPAEFQEFPASRGSLPRRSVGTALAISTVELSAEPDSLSPATIREGSID